VISRPIPVRFLGAGFDDLATDEILGAYDLPDYPDQLAGDGFWCDLFADEAHNNPVGRLWTNRKNGCGLLWLPQMSGEVYTHQALLIRLYRQEGLTASEAFDRIATEWWTGPVYQGLLDGIEPDPAVLGVEDD